MQNASVFSDDFIKKKLKRVVAKIQLLKLGTLKEVDKVNFKRRNNTKKRTVGIITNNNINQFLSHKIAVNSVLCRR